MDGWLHAVRVCSARRVCRRQSAGRAVSVYAQQESENYANGWYYICTTKQIACQNRNTHFQRLSAMEKGQCPTVATWESGNVRSRKGTPTVTTPGQVNVIAVFL